MVINAGDYADFLAFMEEEYKKLGSPQKYAEVMALFRAVDADFNETHRSWSRVTLYYDTLREKIRQERTQTPDNMLPGKNEQQVNSPWKKLFSGVNKYQ